LANQKLLCRLDLLKDEFPTVPVRHLTNTLRKEKTLFKSFGALEEQLRTYRQVATPFSKIGKARIKRGTELTLIERGSQVPKELHAAKRRKEIVTSKPNFFPTRGVDPAESPTVWKLMNGSRTPTSFRG